MLFGSARVVLTNPPSSWECHASGSSHMPATMPAPATPAATTRTDALIESTSAQPAATAAAIGESSSTNPSTAPAASPVAGERRLTARRKSHSASGTSASPKSRGSAGGTFPERRRRRGREQQVAAVPVGPGPKRSQARRDASRRPGADRQHHGRPV